MAGKTQIVKYIGERGISAAKKFFGNSKTNGVASLSDEQLGKGLNMFEKKRADKAGAKAAPKPKPKAPNKMDFPAPVSPVRAIKPFSNSKSSFSIIAKFSILNSFSTNRLSLYFRIYV